MVSTVQNLSAKLGLNSDVVDLSMRSMSAEQYLRASIDPTITDALGRYDRGEIDYIKALERIAVYLLSEQTLNR